MEPMAEAGDIAKIRIHHSKATGSFKTGPVAKNDPRHDALRTCFPFKQALPSLLLLTTITRNNKTQQRN